MNKYIIYIGADGYTKARQLKEGETEQQAMNKAKQAGFEVLRDRAIVGSDPADAVTRYDKASKLRGEAQEIYKDVESPQAIKAYTQKKDSEFSDIESAKKKQQDYAEAQALTDTGNIGNAQATLKQMGRSVPKLITSAYQAIMEPEDLDGDGEPDRMQTFADRYIMPYESELAQSTLGDPTLVPSMAIPSVGGAKIANVAGKIIKQAPKAEKIIRATEKPARYAIDSGIQGGVASLANDDVGVAESMALGTILPSSLDAVGEVGKMTGGKIMQAMLKPKERHLDKFDVDELMSAKRPDGTNVVGAFNSMEKMNANVKEASEEYQKLQLDELELLPEGVPIEFMEDQINTKIDDLIRQTSAKIGAGMSPKEAQKTIDILEMERESLLRRGRNVEDVRANTDNLIPIGGEVDSGVAGLRTVHENRMSYGGKGRYDVTDQATSDPTTRNAYRKMYGVSRDAITETEVHAKEMLKNPEYATKATEQMRKKAQLEKMWYNVLGAKNDLKNMDAETASKAMGMIDNQTKYITKEMEKVRAIDSELAEFRKGKSVYDVTSKKMSPLVTASEVLDNAERRTGKNNLLSLSSMILGAGAFGATQSPTATIVGILAPQMLQSIPSSTAMYRGGEALQRIAPNTGRYAVPAMIRANDE